MGQFKIIATLSWKANSSDESVDEFIKKARLQLEKLIKCNPDGDDFESFNAHLDIIPMRERKRVMHVASFDVDEILAHVTFEDKKKEFVVNGNSYSIKMSSDRYLVFKRNRMCVSCGLEGTKMILDLNPGDQNPHFNLYGEENGRLVLMTKDHIVPKAKGGQDVLDNYQTCCMLCNNLKGDFDLSIEQVRELRQLYRNEERLSKKELNELIRKIRGEFTTQKGNNGSKGEGLH